MANKLYRGDLPADLSFGPSVAIDTETMGLALRRYRLCVVQLSPGDGSADVVQVPAEGIAAPNLKKLFADASVLKIFHFARFDLGVLRQAYSHNLRAALRAEIDKDFVKLPVYETEKHLAG